jgi:hypothetical protein
MGQAGFDDRFSDEAAFRFGRRDPACPGGIVNSGRARVFLVGSDRVSWSRLRPPSLSARFSKDRERKSR